MVLLMPLWARRQRLSTCTGVHAPALHSRATGRAMDVHIHNVICTSDVGAVKHEYCGVNMREGIQPKQGLWVRSEDM